MEELQKYSGETKLTSDDIKTLIAVGIIPKDTPPEQANLFARVCYEKNLSPFSKQIHLIARKDTRNNTTRYTHQTAIDGFRAIADRTGKYAGNDDYLFDDGLTEYQIISQGKKKPQTATATIYKIVGGVRCSFSATARWEEYYPGGNMGFMWDKMPFLMLGKCAESLALRKAFPENLSGIYSNDEMMQADAEVTIAEPIENRKKPILKKQNIGKVKPEVAEVVDPIDEEIQNAKTVNELTDIWAKLTEEQRPIYLDKLSTRKSIIKANGAAA